MIYYWAPAKETLLKLHRFLKDEQDDLSPQQVRTLRMVMDEEYE